MGGLIPLLIIFSIIEAIVSKNKKKAEEAKRKAAIPQSAAQPKPKPRPQPKPQQVRIPYTKEEWNEFLTELNGDIAPEKPKKQKPAPARRPLTELHSEFESAPSSEGESHEEHAEHLRRIEEEEAQHRQEREALNDLREANLDRLRAAVVMSEVLGKPVSLRPRVGYHR